MDWNYINYHINVNSDSCNCINNFEYETRLNDEKRNIFVIREGYLQEFLNDMREIMTYDESSEFIDGRTIQTENTNITLP